jgi:DNA repair protein RecO (recombination protein O)
MRVTLTPAFILHHRPYKETSMLLELFSRDYGRISLVAKGVRRNKLRSPALYQLYRNLNVSWSGRGSLATLTEIEANGPGFHLQGEAMMAAFYINELLMRLLHQHESHHQLFDAYMMALTRLKYGESQLFTLRYFEKQLLDALGYGLVLDYDLDSGEPIQAEHDYYYSIDQGPSSSKPADSDFVRVSGSTLLALDREEFNEQSKLGGIKQLMRLTLRGYLGDKPLASRELYQAYMLQKRGTVTF